MSTSKENEAEFRRYYPIRNQNKVNNTFDFLISDDESVIYKRNNHSSEQFSKLLENQDIFKNFERILNGSFFVSSIREHICNGFELEADGSHKMKFLHGYRLDMLGTYSLDQESAQLILDQCEVLMKKLRLSNETGDFFGDWATHNLVYSFEYKLIINIDLEGFLTYHPMPEWADIDVVEDWLNGVISELQSSISGAK